MGAISKKELREDQAQEKQADCASKITFRAVVKGTLTFSTTHARCYRKQHAHCGNCRGRIVENPGEDIDHQNPYDDR